MSPARRSFRSVVYLAASSLLIPVAAMLEPPWRFVLAAAIVGFWAVGLWDLNHVLAPMPPSEVRFDEALSGIQRAVTRSRDRVRAKEWEQDRVSHLAVLERAIAEARALNPPHSEWEMLKANAIRALEFEATVFRGSRTADSSTGSAAVARWELAGREWDRVRSERSRFFR